jgi:protein-disulfide isomerase
MKTNTIALIVGGVIFLFLFLIGVYKLTNSGGSPTTYPEIGKINASDHYKWSPDKKNILVEYSDFQCPACKNFHEILKTFEASGSPDFKITQKVTFVYRHFPLFQIHQNTLDAAYAAEAAGKQGKFFEMGDLLFDKQGEWSKLGNAKDYFVKLAENLKLDVEKFKADAGSNEVKQKVEVDLRSGENGGINATPTFFLNSKKLDDIRSFDEFKKLLLNAD